MAFSFFGKKDNTPPSESESSGGTFEYSPEKAQKFFSYARNAHEATNYEYAMNLWLGGLRFDPGNIPAIESFFKSTQEFLGTKEGARGPSRDTVKAFSGKSDVDRYLNAMLNWGMSPGDASLAVRATEAAATLGLSEPTKWLGERAIAKAATDKKPRKDHFVSLMRALSKFGAYDLAVVAGQKAVEIDRTDTKLDADVRNMAAEASISRGGFDQTGQEGGFRANIRDAAKQRQLEEEERVVKTESTVERLLATARTEYAARPEDKPTIRKFAKLLLDRGTPEDQEEAYKLLMSAYQTTQDFAFRQAAGDIRLMQLRKKVLKIQQAADAGDERAKALLDEGKRRLNALEIEEFTARVAAYPTDLGMKFELGRRLVDAGKHEEAIGYFQEAKNDGKIRNRVQQYLGRAFHAIGWNDEAVETFRAALEGHSDQNDQLGMELRYGLLTSLQTRAAENKSLDDAEEAYKLASSIAVQQINFRDIRARREELKGLVAQLKG